MLNKYIFVFLFSVSLSAEAIPANSQPQDINMPQIKMLHIAIHADVSSVRFDNVWVFERQKIAGAWDANINLPAGAKLLNTDEPNETTFTKDSGVICKRMAADSLIDSVGFAFELPNKNGKCRTKLTPCYPVKSMVVSVSGSAARLKSDILKFNKLLTSRSAFSSVYSAQNLDSQADINMKLTALPTENKAIPEILCTAGLVLIIASAFFTLYKNAKSNTKQN